MFKMDSVLPAAKLRKAAKRATIRFSFNTRPNKMANNRLAVSAKMDRIISAPVAFVQLSASETYFDQQSNKSFLLA